jgi:hypothetical protein
MIFSNVKKGLEKKTEKDIIQLNKVKNAVRFLELIHKERKVKVMSKEDFEKLPINYDGKTDHIYSEEKAKEDNLTKGLEYALNDIGR